MAYGQMMSPGAALMQQAMARKVPAAPVVETGVDPMAHHRAIAGANALHAVGSIGLHERNRHVAKAKAAIASRKPFGSFAP